MSYTASSVLGSSQKRALLEVLLREEANAQAPRSRNSPMRRVAREHPLRLSYAQERLWFLDQLFPDSHLYNIPAAIRFQGSLSHVALAEGLREIVRRHESLRTTFPAQEGSPVQIISLDPRVTLPLIDLSRLPEGEREQAAVRLATEQARLPFDVERGPLLRARLLRLNAEEHVLLLTLHHIVSDGWSLSVLFTELGALYEAFSQGREARLPELPVQYSDYAAWQREWLSGETLAKQLAYWRQQLSGRLPVLELQTDRPRTAVQSHRGARRFVTLSAGLTRELKDSSRREGVTLYMTLLAAFQTLLHRYTGQTDILVGCPVAGRNRTEIEGLIGFFVNTLVIRTDLSGDPTFRELLKKVKQVTLGAFDHQDIPFEKLVEELHAERSMNHAPLTQVMFSLQNDPMGALHLAGLSVSTLAVESDTSKFDLTLAMSESGQRLAAVLEYDSELFDPSTAERMLVHLEQLLACAAINPELRLSELELLTADESRQLLVEWNETEAAYPETLRIHQLFEQQVWQMPDAVALVSGDEQVSYRELNERANQLAHYLRGLGVGPEVIVGISLERSIEMIVALLAILKAGAAYVPLDPLYPRERLSAMLKETKAPLLLTRQGLVASLPSHQSRIVCLDADWEVIAQESKHNLGLEVGPDNLAYVIFTSGSTGTPKGVMVQHQGICNLAEAQIQAFGLRSSDRDLQFASLNFDASVFEIVMALRVGATLYLGAAQELLPGPGLVEFLRRHAITNITMPPSALGTIADEDLPALQTVIAAGEACPPSLVEQWIAGGTRRFFNAYGPTETTVWASVAECAVGSSLPPIGRPVLNTRIYLLDSHLLPVPVGVAGQLHVGGVGLARGYLNRPDATAEKFIPDPFGVDPGARLYRTGDLGRYLPDGQIEFLGRIDDQVKVRGFRIEPGEVEAALNAHEAVRESIVIARADAPGDKRLVAYLVAAPGNEIIISELRDVLKQRLPAYMVPAAFVILDEMPVTQSGKVDRRNLPVPDGRGAEPGAEYVAPKNEVERIIASVWQEILRLEEIGANDNFFDIGGNSLLVVQVRAKLKELLGKDTPIIEMFNHPTVSALASYLTQGQSALASSAHQGAERATTRRKLMEQQSHARGGK